MLSVLPAWAARSSMAIISRWTDVRAADREMRWATVEILAGDETVVVAA
jgi:hypothetical protein